MDYQRFNVITEDGVRGTLFTRSRFLDSSPHKLVKLENGREFMVRSDLLRSQPDGSYRVTLRSDQIDTASGQPAVARQEPTRTETTRTEPMRMEPPREQTGRVETPRTDSIRADALPAETRSDRGETVIPVIEEELDIERRQIPTGKVLIHKRVDTERTVIEEPLTRDSYDIEKVAVNQLVSAPVEPFYDGDTLVLPVLEEVLVVEKRIMVREEWRIRRKQEQRQERQEVDLRRESLEVERVGLEPLTPDTQANGRK